MEFIQRGPRPNHQAVALGDHTVNTPQPPQRTHKTGEWLGVRFVTAALLFSMTILMLALVAYLFISGPVHEGKFINPTQTQAVILNNGQVYFGSIKTLNEQFVRMDNIYYLHPSQTAQTTITTPLDISSTCKLYGSTDEMLVNRSQIIFWENLPSNTPVAKAVTQFIQQNPNVQNCSTPSPSSGNSSTTTPSPTTSSTTSTTKK